MQNVTVKMDGTLGFLGRLPQASATADRVNGLSVHLTDPWADHGNFNSVPLGRPETGLLGDTRVASPDGQIAIQDLEAGDLVLDATGKPARVLSILKAPTTKTAIRVRAPYFGLNQDLVIGPEHRIAVTSDIAEYLFGEETVLVPAWAIKDGRKARHWEMASGTQLVQVQLDRPAALMVGKCMVESLPKQGQAIGKILCEEEARCFAAEHKSGYQR